jgi:hypothetical protein
LTDWEITAATIYCTAVDEEVTLLIHRDGQINCTGQQLYQNPNRDNARRLVKRSGRAGRKIVCLGIGCATITDYLVEISGGKKPIIPG